MTKHRVTLPSGKKVIFAEPTLADVRRVARVAMTARKNGSTDIDDGNLVPHLVREVDGRKVSYEDLRGDGLSSFLSVKDAQVLGGIIDDFVVPSEEERAAAKKSLCVVVDDEG